MSEMQPWQQSNQPLFSVIIPVYNDAERLHLCLDALVAQTLPKDQFEVLVVDNGSDEPPDALVATYTFAELLHEPKPGSYNARNAACKVAKGRFLAFTDADCRPFPDWLHNALKHFEMRPQTTAIGGAIVFDRSHSPTAAELYEHTISFRQDRFVYRGGFAATANLLVRKEVFAAVGPFNGILKSGGDRDWGQRLTAAGYRLDYSPAVAVAHPPRAKLNDLIKKRRRLEAGFRTVPMQQRKNIGQTASSGWQDQPQGLSMAATLLLQPHTLGLTRLQGLNVLAVATLLIATGMIERARLMLGGNAKR